MQMNDGDLDEIVKRLKRVDKIVLELDPAIRAAAFATLEPWIVKGAASPTAGQARAASKPNRARRAASSTRSTIKATVQDVGDNSALDRDAFFLKFNHSKPSDNALLIAAWHYNQYGLAPVSVDDIRAIADDVGLTIPSRVD